MQADLRAVIFDFNGVIINDEHQHHAAFRAVLAGRGVDLSEQDYYGRYLGLDDRGLFQAVLGAQDAAELQGLVAHKAEAYLRELEDGFELFPGAAELIRQLAGALPLAIASGALRDEIALVLQRSGLGECFTTIVSADEVSAGKPDPEGYLLAWQRLRQQAPGCADLEPTQCLVLEDAPNGIAAARAAGMVCVAVASSRPAAELGSAHAVVADLQQLDLERLQRIHGDARR